MQIAVNNTLFFCPTDKLNDPLDSRVKLKIINPHNYSYKTSDLIKGSGWFLNEELTTLLRDAGLQLGYEESQTKLFKEFFSHLQNNYLGICSFSNTHSENLLWSHYSNEAKGICFVFDNDQLLKSIKSKLSKRNVKIKHEKVSYRGVKKLEVKLFKNGEFEFTNNHLFSKTTHWKYEKEFRIVLMQNPGRYLTNGKFYPFVDFDRDCLKYILLGERMPKEHRKILFNMKDRGLIKAEFLDHKFD